MVAYVSISCLSANLYISIPTKQDNRKKPKSKSSLELWKLRLELEHSSLKEKFHLSAWVFVFALVGIAFVGMNQTYYTLPPTIANFYAYRIVMVLSFVHFLLIIIGFFVGIIYQLIHDMENVIQALKIPNKKPTR